ncbi:MAG: guanine deaminase [Candidatus Kapaibacterium sp.]
MQEIIYRGHIIHSIDQNIAEEFSDGGLVIGQDGRIIFCGNFHEAALKFTLSRVIDTSSYILPGMIDTHTHFVQYPAIGTGSGELLPWLRDYIFPLESRFSDEDFARRVACEFFRDVVKSGTTTIVALGSMHGSGVDAGFLAARETGIRAFIGKCLMDRAIPGIETQSARENIDEAAELAGKWHSPDKLLNYILYPRFAPACTMELLRLTAELSEERKLLIQTHLSENRSELERVRELFPGAGSYADVYYQAGMLTARTSFAHCIHLSEPEIGLLKQFNCKALHCPASNRYLKSGTMPVRKLLGCGIPVGLGTDIAAGYNISIIKEMLEAIETSKTYASAENGLDSFINADSALYMATLGGAQTLGIDSETGNFAAGKSADFVVIEKAGEIFESSARRASDRISQIIYMRGKHPVKSVFVRGRRVYEAYSS